MVVERARSHQLVAPLICCGDGRPLIGASFDHRIRHLGGLVGGASGQFLVVLRREAIAGPRDGNLLVEQLEQIDRAAAPIVDRVHRAKERHRENPRGDVVVIAGDLMKMSPLGAHHALAVTRAAKRWPSMVHDAVTDLSRHILPGDWVYACRGRD